MEYVLASGSPRRRELLSRILNEFIIQPADIDERVDLSLSPEDIAETLAENKCGAVFKTHPDKTVIGCDTIVVFGNEILGKPKDSADAVKTLKRLSGKIHRVITGVCVRRGDKKLTGHECTRVTFNKLSDDFIRQYVNGGSPLDKAGSYGIQDEGVVKEYDGDYTNVVGLPVDLVKKMIEEVRK